MILKLIPFFTLIVLLTACGEEKEDLKAQKAPIVTVDVVQIKAGEVIRSIAIPGSVIPNEQVDVYSEVAGRIQRISFKEGQNVSKGSVIIQVDSDILKAQKAQLMVTLDLAEKDQKRKELLYQSKGISLQEYEIAESALANTKAQLDLLNVQISKATIRAPFSGKIGLRFVSEGAFISTNTRITSIVQENPVKIEFSVPEKYTRNVKTGQLIQFQLDGDLKTYSAKVYAFEPRINEGTRMMTVRASLPNPGGLIPGSFVSINYDMGKEENAFMVPSESIIPILKGQKIFVVRNGLIEEIQVEIGIRTPDKVQILGALNEGDQVLISGLLAVRAGMPVKTKLATK
ncbi:efflux RND transporter periplasmic adaptor subunit [Fluviicola taffensis]|uniref:Efflux transporter, RND family, MFP subunit n=1 Tax=Fluviicola taffensis (strain DSM 16823 / NCIMB 13979 / RW262) TaxID=755732 RepID=F2IE51_FLUTR|nr:efflux RND transporter periplasmic adaptor subunit [Fluviicola taffensis]AEA42369.1 efflux transporter, RND family, MFP subunit [Fluviicola taffensis DSM 16823]